MAISSGERLLLLSTLLGLLGCALQGGMPEPRVLDPPQPSTRSEATALSAGAAGAAASPGADPGPPDLESRRFFLSRLGEPSVPFSTEAPPRVTAIALENTARGEAAGMQPLADARTAALAEGQRATMPVTIAPSGCVAFLAQGGLGVVEVDLFLTPAGGGQGSAPATGEQGSAPASEAQGGAEGAGKEVPILAQDNEVGAIAVIGGRGRCFANRSSAQIAADLHAVVRRGAGPVMVQGFRR